MYASLRPSTSWSARKKSTIRVTLPVPRRSWSMAGGIQSTTNAPSETIAGQTQPRPGAGAPSPSSRARNHPNPKETSAQTSSAIATGAVVAQACTRMTVRTTRTGIVQARPIATSSATNTSRVSASTLMSGSQKLASMAGVIACMTTPSRAAVQRYSAIPPRRYATSSTPTIASPLKRRAPIWSPA